MKRTFVTATLLLLIALPLAAQTAEDEIGAAAYSQDALQLTPPSPSVTHSIVVDATQSFSVSLLAASRTLGVGLLAPNGVRYRVGDPDTATFQSGFFAIDAPSTSPGASYLISISDPFPGNWTLEVSEGATLSAPVDVLVTTLINNSVRLVLAGGGESFPSGRDIRLALAAFDGTAKIAPLSIAARLFRPFDPTFTPASVSFRDDGLGADEVSGDRIYSAFVNPVESGSYQLQVDATGSASTGSFKRTAAADFRVVPHIAQITGFTDRGIDENGDGLFDRIGVRPSATLTGEGTFLVTVVLRGSNGHELQKSTEAAFSVGTGSVEVLFSADDLLRDLAVDAPWSVAEVRYYRNTGNDLVPADIRYDLGSTSGYTLAQLQRPRLRLSGTGTATGVDFDGDGLYDRLNVALGIANDFAGFYNFSCSLTDRNGTDLGFRSGSVYFPADAGNVLNLSFAGQPIGQNGVDGPYFVSNFLMFGAGHSLVEATAFTTPLFSAAQFEGFILDNTPPVLTLSVTPDVLWPPDHQMVEITAKVSATDDRDPDPEVDLVSITSNEDQNDLGDGNTESDIVVENGTIYLRAERSGLGNDRIYTITYRARDAAGNTSTASATVTVPHDKR